MISSFIMLFEVGLRSRCCFYWSFACLPWSGNDPFVPASVVTMVAGHQHSANLHYQRLNRNAPLPLRSSPLSSTQTPVD